VTTTANRMAVTPRKVSQGGMPKMVAAAIMPMYSVTSVSQFTMARSASENQPQTGPNPSKTASAWPRLVTAPRRTVISWA
jgi:hypothetical protein